MVVMSLRGLQRARTHHLAECALGVRQVGVRLDAAGHLSVPLDDRARSGLRLVELALVCQDG